MEENKRQYYVYRHIRLDKNEVFYIGIGTKKLKKLSYKSLYSRAFDKTSRNFLWKRITEKTKYKVEIIFEDSDRFFIKQKEQEFISLYGRKLSGKGTLCNLTIGGDGGGNYKLITSLDLVFLHNVIDNVLNEFYTIKKSCIYYKRDIEVFYRLYNRIYSKDDFKIYEKSSILLNKQKRNRIFNIIKLPSKKTNKNIKNVIDLYLTKKYKIKEIGKILNINKDLVGKILKENLNSDVFEKLKTNNRAACQLKHFGKIFKYDLNGNLIKIYSSIEEVDKEGIYNKQCIYRCFLNKSKTHKKFIWKKN